MNRELIGKSVALLVSYREYTEDCRIANVCGEIVEALKSELLKPEQEPVCDKDPYLCEFVKCQLGKVCKHIAQSEQSKYSDIVSEGGLDPRNKFDAQPEQDGVAWMEMVVANLVRLGVVKHKAKELAYHFYTYDPPPKRQWVGLTEHEKISILMRGDFNDWADDQLLDAIESKLKEKNCNVG
jgi:hypothetical protein